MTSFNEAYKILVAQLEELDNPKWRDTFLLALHEIEVLKGDSTIPETCTDIAKIFGT